jgi:hypothetical protein
VFNQFANAINLLNEARLDLPIAIKYRYHILSVAKPNAVAPQEGLRAFGYELNEPAPTSGSYCVREYCRHAVTVGNSFDRYEQFTPSWVGHSVIGKWTDPEGESGTSEWYTSYGHTEFQADREYGYRRWPLMESEVDASVAGSSFRSVMLSQIFLSRERALIVLFCQEGWIGIIHGTPPCVPLLSHIGQ